MIWKRLDNCVVEIKLVLQGGILVVLADEGWPEKEKFEVDGKGDAGSQVCEKFASYVIERSFVPIIWIIKTPAEAFIEFKNNKATQHAFQQNLQGRYANICVHRRGPARPRP